VAQSKEERVRVVGQIVARAWGDDAFRQSIAKDPMGVLKANGLELAPEIKEMRIVGSRSDVKEVPGVGFLVIPTRPSEVELSDEELEHVSGGGDNYGRDDRGTGDADPATKGF
jgi:hypothetical protein